MDTRYTLSKELNTFNANVFPILFFLLPWPAAAAAFAAFLSLTLALTAYFVFRDHSKNPKIIQKKKEKTPRERIYVTFKNGNKPNIYDKKSPEKYTFNEPQRRKPIKTKVENIISSASQLVHFSSFDVTSPKNECSIK